MKIEIPVLFDVRRSPELYERIAFLAGQYVFGTIYLRAVEDPTMVMVALEHNLLGDYLDEGRTRRRCCSWPMSPTTSTTSSKTEFGGERFHEEG